MALRNRLDPLVKACYLDTDNDGQYSFAHDKIQEAATNLVPEDCRSQFYYQIGVILVTKLNTEDLDSILFSAVDLLNAGTALLNDDTQRRQLAIANYMAAQKALSSSAYEAAADFASQGISLIGAQMWDRDKYAILDLYLIGCNASAYIGLYDEVDRYFDAVTSRPDIPIEEKLDLFTVWLDSVAQRGQTSQAAKLSLDLLSTFNCRFPRTNFGILFKTVTGVVALKRRFKKRRLQEFQSVMTDPIRQKLVVILNNLTTYLSFCQSDLIILAVMRNLEWSIKYGVNEYSSVTLAKTATMFGAVLGDFEIAKTLADGAINLVESARLHEAATLEVVHGTIMHLMSPLRNNLKPLVHAYELGLRSGDTETAGLSMLFFIQARFVLSFPLDLLADDLYSFASQMKEFKRQNCYEIAIVYWEFLDSIVGRSDCDILDYGGNHVSNDELNCWYKANPRLRKCRNFLRSFLCFLYGKYEQCADLAAEFGHDEYWKGNPGVVTGYFELLSKGISCYAAAGRTKKRKYKRLAQIIHRRIIQLANKGNPNVIQYKLILDAEKHALKGRHTTAMALYNNAVVMSARGGYLLEAAVSSERLAHLHLQKKDERETSYRLEQACKYYTDLGAHRKVELLRQTHSYLLPQLDIPQTATVVPLDDSSQLFASQIGLCLDF
jgi:predicted ATPase